MKLWPFSGKKKNEGRRTGRRGYDGAVFNRLVSDWVTQTTSMDAELRSSLLALRNRSRDLARNNDYVRQFLRAVQNNVIGQGIGFQAQVQMQRGGKLDEKTNGAIETAWAKWTRKENCHVAGKLCFQDIERLAIRSIAESGEILVRTVNQAFGESKIPLALEIIEPDLLDENYNDTLEGGRTVKMGVELDQWQRPIAYHFLASHPGDFQAIQGRSARRRRVPADEIEHVFVTERPGQTRGSPWLASAIMRLHHMKGYEESSVVRARASAAVMGFITNPNGEPGSDGVEDDKRLSDFESGVFKYLEPGEEVTVPQVAGVAGEFDPFMRAMLRGVAAGLGTSYETISRDYSQTNYSSSRQALLEDRDNWRALQAWIVANLHQRIFEKFLFAAVLSGEIQLPGYEVNPDRYRSVRWMPRGWGWVDPAKEVAAYKEAIRGGLKTQTDIIAENGGDFEELMMQRQREVKRAKELGLSFDTNAEEPPEMAAEPKKKPEKKPAKEETEAAE